jgi:hypothetical protein
VEVGSDAATVVVRHTDVDDSFYLAGVDEVGASRVLINGEEEKEERLIRPRLCRDRPDGMKSSLSFSTTSKTPATPWPDQSVYDDDDSDASHVLIRLNLHIRSSRRSKRRRRRGRRK